MDSHHIRLFYSKTILQKHSYCCGAAPWTLAILLLAQLRALQPAGVRPGLLGAMWTICFCLLAAGVLTVLLDAWDEVLYESVEDAFEWVLTLLLQSNSLLGYFVWRQADWRVKVES